MSKYIVSSDCIYTSTNPQPNRILFLLLNILGAVKSRACRRTDLSLWRLTGGCFPRQNFSKRTIHWACWRLLWDFPVTQTRTDLLRKSSRTFLSGNVSRVQVFFLLHPWTPLESWRKWKGCLIQCSVWEWIGFRSSGYIWFYSNIFSG